MIKFIKNHPYISLQIFSVVLALFLIAILFISIMIYATKEVFLPAIDVTRYWVKIAPIFEIVIVYIFAIFLYNKNFLKALCSISLSPIIWLSLIVLIITICDPYNML